ncbi:MAG TPA: hypothetical protein PLV68_08220, partial [Ilumatobacteraceae bacterium]|nr:hypothetical protein [Ilumatobacteraceae bacterium]
MNLVVAATRRTLAVRRRGVTPEEVREDAEARVHMEAVMSSNSPEDAAEWLLGWLDRRKGERA